MPRRRALLAAIVAIAFAVAAYWWWSPRWVLYRMQRAGALGDALAVSAHVDEAALRDNLKGQFAAAMAGKIGAPSDNPLSAFGTMVGMAFVNPLVEVMVRPQTIGSAMQTGRVRPGAAGAAADRVEWELEREGADRVVFHPHPRGEAVDPKSAAFVFVRHGFADWKLSEIRMQLAQ